MLNLPTDENLVAIDEIISLAKTRGYKKPSAIGVEADCWFLPNQFNRSFRQ